MRASVTAALAFSTLAAAGAARGAPADSQLLVVGARGDDFAPGGSGAGAEATWIRLWDRGTLEAGAATFALPAVRWSYLHLGGTRAAPAGATLSASADLGHGRSGEGFAYVRLRIGVARDVAVRRLRIELEDQYLDVDEARGNLLKVGLAFSPSSAWSTALAYHASTGGNVHARYVSGRGDLRLRSGRAIFAGFALGRARPVLFDLPPAEVATESTELFAGFQLPLSSWQLTVALDVLNVGSQDRRSLLVGLKIPIG